MWGVVLHFQTARCVRVRVANYPLNPWKPWNIPGMEMIPWKTLGDPWNGDAALEKISKNPVKTYIFHAVLHVLLIRLIFFACGAYW